MNGADKLMVIWLIAASCALSSYFTYHLAIGEAEEIVKGYHCQSITKHSTLESAKAQVSAYHEMVRG